MPARASYRNPYILAAIFAVAAIVILYANFRAAQFVSGALTSALGQPVSVGRVGISPVSGLTFYDFRIGGGHGTGSDALLTVKSISIIPDYGELLKRRLVISGVYVLNPALSISRDRYGNWNFKPLMDRLTRPGGPARKFTLNRVRIIKGSISAPGGYSLKDIEAGLDGLSSIKPGPALFRIKAGDGRGNSVSADGSLNIFGGHKEVDTSISITAMGLSGYLPKDRSLEGIKVLAKANLSYSLSKDVLIISNASVDAEGLAGLTASGRISGLKREGALDIAAKVQPVKLSSFSAYLPKDTTVAGVVRPEEIKVRGSLRPLRIAASARAAISDAGFSLKGTAISGINGLAGLTLSPDGMLRTDFRLTAAGGSLTGSASYKDGGSFNLKAENLSVGSVRKDIGGTVDSNINGTYGRSLKEIKANYLIKLTKLSYKDDGSAVDANVQGRFEEKSGTVTLAGVISASGGLRKKPLQLTSAYTYAGDRLRLSNLSFNGFDGVSLTAGEIDAGIKDGIVSASLKDASVRWQESVVLNGIKADAKGVIGKNSGFSGSLSALSGTAYDIPFNFTAGYRFDSKSGDLAVTGSVADNPMTAKGGMEFSSAGGLIKPALSGNLVIHNLSFINPLLKKRGVVYSMAGGSADASFNLGGQDLDSIAGTASIRAEHLSVNRGDTPVLQEISAEFHPVYQGGGLVLPEATVTVGEKLAVRVAGEAKSNREGWSVSARASMPETGLSTVQDEVLEFLPPAIKWADTGGNISFDTVYSASPGQAGKLSGELRLNGVTLSMPDKKVEVGPVDGSAPISYLFGKKSGSDASHRLDVFNRENYPILLSKYSSAPTRTDSLTIKRAYFGLIGLDDIGFSLEPGDGFYRLAGLKASGFGGKYYGNGVVDFSGKAPVFTFSLLVNDFSLSELCRRIPPINGYVSGRVDGLVRIKMSGGGLEGVTGAGMIWAKTSPLEKRQISKELLKKIAGKSLKNYMLLFGGRDYDTGEIDVVISEGFMVFDKLQISNRNILGYQDLMITVAPVSNKISLEHLLDVIKDVSGRAGGANPAFVH